MCKNIALNLVSDFTLSHSNQYHMFIRNQIKYLLKYLSVDVPTFQIASKQLRTS